MQVAPWVDRLLPYQCCTVTVQRFFQTCGQPIVSTPPLRPSGRPSILSMVYVFTLFVEPNVGELVPRNATSHTTSLSVYDCQVSRGRYVAICGSPLLIAIIEHCQQPRSTSQTRTCTVYRALELDKWIVGVACG